MSSVTHWLVPSLLPFPTSLSLQSDIQHAPGPSIPPGPLAFPQAPMVHLPFFPDEGVFGGSGGDSPKVGAVSLWLLSAWSKAESQGQPRSLGLVFQAVLSRLGGRRCELRLPAPLELPAFPSELDNRKNR